MPDEHTNPKPAGDEPSFTPAEVTYCMVLADGETFSELEGCRIVALPKGADDLTQAHTIVTFGSAPAD